MARSARPKPHPESLSVGALLTALVALGQISTSIYTPSLPALVAALDTDVEQVNQTFTVFLVGFALCQLVYGPLSDRFGRRPVLLTGLALYLVSSFACAFAGSIDALITGRFVQGMAACVGPVLGRAIVRDVYGPERSATAMAYIGAALAISPAVAPIIGGYLQVWFGWRAVFAFLTAVGALILSAAWALLRETNLEPIHRSVSSLDLVRSYATLLTSRVYLGYTLAVSFVFAGLMAFAAGGPFVFIALLGLSPERFGMLAVFSVAGYLCGSLAAGRLTARLGIERLVLVGLSLCILGGGAMVVLALAGILTIPAIIGPMMVFTAGMGIVFADGIAGALAPFPRMAGAASALLGFIQMAVAAGATIALGAFAPASQRPMAGVIAVASAAALAAFTVLVLRPRASRP